MNGALPIDAVTSGGCPAALRRHAPPRVELPPLDIALGHPECGNFSQQISRATDGETWRETTTNTALSLAMPFLNQRDGFIN